MISLSDPTLTIEEFARVAARTGMTRMKFKRAVWARAEAEYLREVLRMAGGKNLRAAKLAGVRRPNFIANLRCSERRRGCLGI